MEYVYAALLLHNSGKKITEKNITAVLKAAGINADVSRVKALIAALEGVNIEEAVSQAAMPAAQPAPAPAEAAPAAEEKKKEEKKEEAEETGMEGLSALFG
ncbi:MAG: 50S ribosomal protein P1 [Methanocellales archaeon]|nr:50S ribosomal protein P1 [Methanocellales archaeon]